MQDFFPWSIFRWKHCNNHYICCIFISLCCMKKAFTLIELMIVITVIGILMGVTMKFSSNRITDLKAQSLKDAFVDNYAMVQSQNLASSYHGTWRYATGQIIFDPTTGVLAVYDTIATQQLLPDITNMRILLSWTASLSFSPYHMWCLLDVWTWVSFGLEVNRNKTYCFSINPATCSLKELPCVPEK